MKVGIITLYYKSNNYGGNLQAFALVDFLRSVGYNAEQICYDRDDGRKNLVRKIRYIIRNFFFNYVYALVYKKSQEKINIRKKNMLQFNSFKIKRSKIIYTEKTINNILHDYDVLITGSDQVWHPSAVCDAYLLDFRGKNIRKISYAASVSQDSISDSIKRRYKNAFTDFYAISVREEESVHLIQQLTNLKVEWVLDPVFLKSKNEWENLAISSRINERYIFCYFLGDSISHRILAKEYANKIGLKIVTLPFLTNKYRECDADFGDYRLYDVSPFEFVGLIKDAEYVFTDSFHAVAFSTILEKEFFVFERNAKSSMGSRIRSITDLAGVSERYCYNQERCNVDYILELSRINYANTRKELDAMISKSKDFLLTNLGDKG